MARRPIGELLVERGAITRDQLEAGLSAQRRTRQRLGVTLLQQGVLSEVHLAQVLAESLSLATVDLAQVQVDWSAVHMLRARFCEAHELFPFAVDGKGTGARRLLVALADPLDHAAIEEIEFTTGLRVGAYVATHGQVRQAILRYYHKQGDAPPADEAPMVVGEVLPPDPAPRPTATAPPARALDPVGRELDALFGQRPGEETDVEKLERKFWALLRVMQRKGLITRDEFLAELERGE